MLKDINTPTSSHGQPRCKGRLAGIHQKPGFPLKCTHLLGMAIGSLRRLLPQYQQELTDISVSRVTSGAHFPFGPQRSSLETFWGRELVTQAPPLRLVWVKQVAPQAILDDASKVPDTCWACIQPSPFAVHSAHLSHGCCHETKGLR